MAIFKDRTLKSRFPDPDGRSDLEAVDLLDFPLGPGPEKVSEPQNRSGKEKGGTWDGELPATEEGGTWVEEDAPNPRGPRGWGPTVRRLGSRKKRRAVLSTKTDAQGPSELRPEDGVLGDLWVGSEGRSSGDYPSEGQQNEVSSDRKDEAASKNPRRLIRKRGAYGSELPGEPKAPRSSSRLWIWVLLFLAFPLVGALGYYLNLAPPVMALSQNLVDLGAIRLGTTSSGQQVEVSNQGQEALRITQVLIEGAAAAEFRLEEDACSGQELAAGTGCFLTMGFQPTVEGSRQAHLELISNATNSPLSLALVGVGTAPRLRLDPEASDFSTRTVGTASSPRTFRLENIGTAAVDLGYLELEGLGAADFVMADDGCSGQSLEPGANCEVKVAFVPTKDGVREGTLRVDGASGEVSVSSLRGEGLPQEPAVRLSPNGVSVGDVRVGEASLPEQVEIWNDGNGPLEILSLRPVDAQSLVGEEGGQGGLEVLREDCTQTQVKPAEHCQVSVRLAPTEEGEARAFLEIRHTAGEGLHKVPVSGRGVAPHAAISPQRLSFGEAPVGSPADVRAVSLRSSGSAPLPVGAMALEGADAQSFELRPTSCSGSTLQSGSECRIEVVFTARREGPHRAELVIRHGADAGVERLPVNGIGVAARLAVDRRSVDFGEVPEAATAVQRLVLNNTGRALLRIRKVTFDRRDAQSFELKVDRCSGIVLEPAARCELEVAMRTTTPGSHQSRLLIDHDGAAGAKEVSVSGFVRAPPKPVLGDLPTQLDFGVQGLGERSEIQSLNVRSVGTGPLRIWRSKIEGPQALDFHQVSSRCSEVQSIAAGTACEVTLRFIPAGEGSRRARWILEHDGPGSPTVIVLEGTGVLSSP